MASALARSLGIARTLGRPCPPRILKRSLTVTSSLRADKPKSDQQLSLRPTKSVLEEEFDADDLELLLTENETVADSPSLGHEILQMQREVLHYMRLIEHEMPKLVAYRQPFIPPDSKETPLIVRHIHYQGEAHPALAKRAIVVSVDSLPLKTPEAIHKFKLVAGARWTPNPPKDGGLCEHEPWGNGFFKISCDTFQNSEMNLKWASDALDRLVAEANNAEDTFSELPLDLRHVYAKSRKAKKGDHRRDRALNTVSVADFPKAWLPPTPA